jgi:hypothetical protein
MSLALQDLLVTLIAFGALCLVTWRLIGIVGPSQSKPGCSKCPSCPSAASIPAGPRQPGRRTKIIRLSDGTSRT